jgi:4'-phosphopantetheinyl transferase EntD
MIDPVAIEHLLVRLSPRGSGVAVACIGDVSTAGLSDAERDLVRGSAPTRRQEFAAGRSCAHRALAAIGADTPTIGRGSRRQPLWPPGVTGSISHAAELAAAVALPVTSTVRAVGLDVERADAVEDELWPQVLNPFERAACAAAPEPGATATAVFGAKEAAFKAIHPVYAVEIDFLEACARVDGEGGIDAVEVPHLATSVVIHQGRVGPLVVSLALLAGGEVRGRS